MWVGYPGERGGEAIAGAVFGATDSFGKMSFSIYKQEYYSNGDGSGPLSPTDFSMRPNAYIRIRAPAVHSIPQVNLLLILSKPCL